MATRDSIQIADKTIKQINQMGEILRNAANSVITLASQIDGLTAITEKKAILLDGLNALQINIAELNNDKTTMVDIANYINNNVPALTTW